MRHDLSELSISLWEFIWGVYYLALYFSTWCLLNELFLMVGNGLMGYSI